MFLAAPSKLFLLLFTFLCCSGVACSEFIFFEIAYRFFFLLNRVCNVKIYLNLFKMVACERLCIPFDKKKKKKGGRPRAFFFF